MVMVEVVGMTARMIAETLRLTIRMTVKMVGLKQVLKQG
jgi:hypothetical protein